MQLPVPRSRGATLRRYNMTLEEKVIISAYTGVLLCDFQSMHEYIEKKLGRPVWTHELADERVWKEIKNATRADLMEILKKED